MQILLVGNYEGGDSQSMPRFGEMLRRELSARGHEVRLLRPKAYLGKFSLGRLTKWLSYFDQYVVFPPRLWLSSRASPIVHICDHSNSVYLDWVQHGAVSITCHDLLAILSSEGRFPGRSIGYTGRIQQRWIKKNLLKIKHVACVSSNTARELEVMGSKGILEVIPNCLHSSVFVRSNNMPKTVAPIAGLTGEERYILQVGGNSWYKNRPGILRIFAALVRREGFTDLKLVMAGHPLAAEMEEEVVQLGLSRAIVTLENPSDTVLRSLYMNAEALLFASLHEGFGWPIIEAQSLGCTVITSDREPMREVAGAAAIFVDPEDPDLAANKIAEAWPTRDELQILGLRNVERFTVERVIEQYERFFEDALK